MSAFSTFSYTKKYFVSNEIEFVTEPDLEFSETYKPPQDLINLLADNLIVGDAVGGVGTTIPKAKLYSYGTVGVGETEVLGYPVNTLIEVEDGHPWAIGFRRTDLGPKYDVAEYIASDGTFYFASGDGASYTSWYNNLGISTNNFQVFTNDSISFRVDSNANSLVYNNLLVGTQTLTGTPNQRLQVNGGGYFSDSVGIGITTPSNTLTVTGSGTSTAQLYVPGISTFKGDIYVLGPFWDKLLTKGIPGQVLFTDSNGVFWGDVSGIGTPLQTIGIYDENIFKGTVSNLNFFDGNDPDNLVNATIGITSSFANIVISDRWSLSGSDVYRMSKVGIQNSTPTSTLDITGTLHATGAVDFDSTLNVDGAATLQTTLNVKGATDLDTTLNVDGASTLQTTLNVKGATDLDTTLNVIGITTLRNQLIVGGATSLASTLLVGAATTLRDRLIVGGASSLASTLLVGAATTLNTTLQVGVGGTVITTTGIGSVGIGTYNPEFDIDLAKNVKFRKAIIDTNNSTAVGKFDYRLSSVGTGVSWRPPGVQTQNAIWVTIDGNDLNSGYLEGDAKRTIGAAASIAEAGDTIFIRSGVYYENNPIGLRTDVSVSGQDLRLVTIVPQNTGKDIFHVRRGCLIENMNFACDTGQSNPGGGALAFPPTTTDIVAGKSYGAVSGYTAPGPATEGSSGRWRSPYVRNCTNFMPLSIGMKINGDHASASTIGADLKCMVCDSFTQYNEAGLGVSITNNGYAQLVSIFTINCDKAIYVDSGGQCDLTNSNSSFGNYGLYAVGLGRTEFTAKVNTSTTAEADTIVFKDVTDGSQYRRPYDGQALWFKINLSNYNTGQTGIITAPLQRLKSVTVINGGSGYSAGSPPDISIYDFNTNSSTPLGPEGIIAEVSPTISDGGAITTVDLVNSGRNYLSSQNIKVKINGTPTNDLVAVMEPIYYTVDSATPPTVTGISTVTLNEFVPYLVYANNDIEIRRISRILTSGHSFEYIGTGTDINTSTPLKGAVPIKENEVVALDGAQIPYTSTDQKGNFNIGEGIQVDQTTATITGRDFSKAIQAQVTPLILALR